MTNTYTISPTISNSTIKSILPGSTVGGTITLNTGAGSGYSISGIGSSGTSHVYTTNGTGTSNWATPNTNFNDGSSPVMTIPHGSKTVEIDKAATLDVKGNVKINGIDLEERLRTIEKVLMIPERDAIMEVKYPSLKKKFDDYINALGKYRTFEAIKGKDE
jgi:hypothetical protein